MTFDLHAILRGKSEFRRRLATLPIEEKLRMLDALRERELAIRGKSHPTRTLRERLPGGQDRREP